VRRLLAGIVKAVALVSSLGPGLAAADAAPSTAGPACPARAIVSPFAGWADTGQYFLIGDGGFENAATERTLGGGAKVVAGT